MKPKKLSLLSIVIVALLSTGYSSVTPAAENLCDITNAPDADLSTLADDLQKKIDKLTELQKSWKEDNAQLIKAADADEASLMLLKIATTLKAATSSMLAIGSGGSVAASPAIFIMSAISNTVGLFNDAANADSKEDLLWSLQKSSTDTGVLIREYGNALTGAKKSNIVSAWSALSTWIGVVNDGREAIKTLKTKSTLRSKLNSMNNQYNKFLNNDIAKLKKDLDAVKKSIDKTDKKLGKDALDLIKKTKKNTVESCQKLNPEPIPELIIPNKPPIITEPKGEGYTKIANDGSELPDSAVLGSNPTDWACTKDNKTGLIWEVKTSDGGLRDKDNTYTNYDAIYPKCYWNDCEKDYPSKLGDSTNTDGFVKAVNTQGLCGSNNWRLPTKSELTSLVYCSNCKYEKLGADEHGYLCGRDGAAYPFINTAYFSDRRDCFWSSSPIANGSDGSWGLSFGYGYGEYFNKYGYLHVRLVRG